MEKKLNTDKEEWGGWKIVAEMLDNPYENGIYPTSRCYQKLYEFVVAQKQKAISQQKKIPMGISAWKNHGKKYGYDKYFNIKWPKKSERRN